MTVSFHKYDGDYFPQTGDVTEIGEGAGRYCSVNVPLQDGIDDNCYEQIFKPIMREVMGTYDPKVIVLQCGADSLAGDRLGLFNLSIAAHGECVRFMKSFGLPMVVTGGGMPPPLPLPSVLDTSRPSPRTNRTRLVPPPWPMVVTGGGMQSEAAIILLRELCLRAGGLRSGGYVIANVARCWALETAVSIDLAPLGRKPNNSSVSPEQILTDTEVPDEVPPHPLCLPCAPLAPPRRGSQTLRGPKLASVDLLLELLCPVFPSPRRASPQVTRPSRSPFYATGPPKLIESAQVHRTDPECEYSREHRKSPRIRSTEPPLPAGRAVGADAGGAAAGSARTWNWRMNHLRARPHHRTFHRASLAKAYADSTLFGFVLVAPNKKIGTRHSDATRSI